MSTDEAADSVSDSSPMHTESDETSPVYIKRIQRTALPGFTHTWFGCQGCDLQGDMTGTAEEVDEVLAVLGAAHAQRHPDREADHA